MASQEEPARAPGGGASEPEGAAGRLAFPREELRGRTARGGLLNALFLGGGEGLALVQGLVVTALLGPVAIGLYGIVTTTAVTVVQLRRVGIDEAFVQQSEGNQEEEFQKAFSLEFTLGVLFSLGLCALAPVLAAVYGEERLLGLTLAVAYLPIAFALQAPQWIFFRRMDFLRLRLLQFAIPAVTFLVTVPLAAVTESVWALVVGPLVGNTVAVIAALVVSPYRLRLRFDRVALRRYLGFSWPIFATAAATLLVLQGQVFAFDLDDGLAAAGYITLAATLTRYADRADQIVATTIYPAICAMQDRSAGGAEADPGRSAARSSIGEHRTDSSGEHRTSFSTTQEELFEKSARVTMVWTFGFCGLLAVFAPDLVQGVLGDEWEPAVVLIQGLAVAAALQGIGYGWFSFYRARGEPQPQAVESAAMVIAFLGLAVPGLLLFGFEGFVAGRIATSLAMLGVRRHYLRRLFAGQELMALGLRGAAPVAIGAGVTLALRELLDAGVIPELALFGATVAGLTWLSDRGLLRELLDYVRPA